MTKAAMKYEKSHPWLTFNARPYLKPAGPELWMMLGECQSKLEHLLQVPLRPDIAEELNRMYVAKGVLATNAIEGNTMTEEEVKKFLEGKLELPPSREYLGQEISNIANECTSILDTIASRAVPVLNKERIVELNKRVLDKLNLPDGVVGGEIRRHEVGVALYRGAPADECEYLLDRLCKWLNDTIEFGEPTGPRAMINAILKAILAHLYLAWIHPFGDGNGRTARLVEYQILVSSGLPAPSAHLLSNHYNLTRSEYYRQLHLASQSGGDVLPFIQYAVQGFLDGLRAQIDLVRQLVKDVVWNTFVADQFQGKDSPADKRRRDLIEQLSRVIEPKTIPIEKLPMLSTGLMKYYSQRTPKTLYRDIGKLFKMHLIRFDGDGIRANKEYIQVFMPMTAKPPEQKMKRRKST